MTSNSKIEAFIAKYKLNGIKIDVTKFGLSTIINTRREGDVYTGDKVDKPAYTYSVNGWGYKEEFQSKCIDALIELKNEIKKLSHSEIERIVLKLDFQFGEQFDFLSEYKGIEKSDILDELKEQYPDKNISETFFGMPEGASFEYPTGDHEVERYRIYISKVRSLLASVEIGHEIIIEKNLNSEATFTFDKERYDVKDLEFKKFNNVLKESFLSDCSTTELRNVIEGKLIKKQLTWRKSIPSLAYLITQLVDKGIFIDQNKWVAASSNFLNKKGDSYNPKTLREKAAKMEWNKNDVKIIDSAISELLSSTA